MAELGTQPEQLGFFLRIRYNASLRQTPAQDPNLGFQEPDLGVVAWREQLHEQAEKRLKGMSHG